VTGGMGYFPRGRDLNHCHQRGKTLKDMDPELRALYEYNSMHMETMAYGPS